MTLSIKDTMHFGKHKGMNVGRLLLEDAGYACWLREEKRKADPRDIAFDAEANDMIDVAIECSRSLKKKYAPWKIGEKIKAASKPSDAPLTPVGAIDGVANAAFSKEWIAKAVAEAKAKREEVGLPPPTVIAGFPVTLPVAETMSVMDKAKAKIDDYGKNTFGVSADELVAQRQAAIDVRNAAAAKLAGEEELRELVLAEDGDWGSW